MLFIFSKVSRPFFFFFFFFFLFFCLFVFVFFLLCAVFTSFLFINIFLFFLLPCSGYFIFTSLLWDTNRLLVEWHEHSLVHDTGAQQWRVLTTMRSQTFSFGEDPR
jgi:hypothetical protein